MREFRLDWSKTVSEIGVYEAKTHLTKLLKRVEKGERIVITRYGKPVAELVPLRQRASGEVRKAIDDMRALRGKLKPVGTKMKSLIVEGRRH